jgi:hypothetical protein
MHVHTNTYIYTLPDLGNSFFLKGSAQGGVHYTQVIYNVPVHTV